MLIFVKVANLIAMPVLNSRNHFLWMGTANTFNSVPMWNKHACIVLSLLLIVFVNIYSDLVFVVFTAILIVVYSIMLILRYYRIRYYGWNCHAYMSWSSSVVVFVHIYPD